MNFYYYPASAPCRAVIMCAKALGVELRKISLNITTNEHMEPWFLAINPQHIVPTIVDNGFVLWESRAIMTYLVEEYGENDDLYPKSVQKQAVINQRLHFDIGSLNRREFYFPIFFFKEGCHKEARRLIEKGFRLLDTFLEGHKFVTGDTMTVADFALLATVSSFEVATYDFSKFKNVTRWYKAAPKVVPGWDENIAGCNELFKRFKRFQPPLKRLKLL